MKICVVSYHVLLQSSLLTNIFITLATYDIPPPPSPSGSACTTPSLLAVRVVNYSWTHHVTNSSTKAWCTEMVPWSQTKFSLFYNQVGRGYLHSSIFCSHQMVPEQPRMHHVLHTDLHHLLPRHFPVVIFLFLFTLFLVILLVDKSKQISN